MTVKKDCMKETSATEVLQKLEEANEEYNRKASEAISLFREAVFESFGINKLVEWLNNRLKDGKE